MGGISIYKLYSHSIDKLIRILYINVQRSKHVFIYIDTVTLPTVNNKSKNVKLTNVKQAIHEKDNLLLHYIKHMKRKWYAFLLQIRSNRSLCALK